jgi:hypothetical protein
MVRRLFFVFGSPRSRRPPLLVSVRRTLSVAVLHVYILPLEGQHLPLAHTSGHGQHVQGFEPVVPRRL